MTRAQAADDAGRSILARSELAGLLHVALDMPAEEGARVLALHWLTELAAARRGWEEALPGRTETVPGDRVADHAAEFRRVCSALRCLRATLREHRALLQTGKRVDRALGELERVTQRARARQERLDWLHAESDSLDPIAADQALLLRSSLASTGPEHEGLVAAFAMHLDRATDTLTSRLSAYVERRVVGHPPVRRSFAAHLAARVAKGTAAIDAGVAEGRARRLRVRRLLARLSHQRAMLAPFTRTHSAVGAWYDLVVRGHDALLAAHDTRRVGRAARARDLPALEAALEPVTLAHLDAFRRTWQESRDAAHAAVAALDGKATVNALPMEIERKYLLRAVPPAIAEVAPIHIEQGWLPGSVLHERLRRSALPDGRVLLTRTVKAGTLGARVELEDEASPELFAAMWPFTEQARIRKLRHRIPAGRFVWEIDVFLDRDLVVAEIELRDPADLPAPPAWLASYIVRDVTDDPSFTNSAMATPDAGNAWQPEVPQDATLGA